MSLKHLTQSDVNNTFECIYQTVGYDLQEARLQCGSPGPMKREELFDVCCDMIQTGEFTPEQLKEWIDLPFDDKVAMGKIALPFETYE